MWTVKLPILGGGRQFRRSDMQNICDARRGPHFRQCPSIYNHEKVRCLCIVTVTDSDSNSATFGVIYVAACDFMRQVASISYE